MKAIKVKSYTALFYGVVLALCFSVISLVALPVQAATVTIPEITTEPVVLGQKTLIWLREGGNDTIPPRPFDYPDLTGQANVLDDWHMQTSPDDWDLLVSTAGNFHRFLNVFYRQKY